jgi:hypothetical protein
MYVDITDFPTLAWLCYVALYPWEGLSGVVRRILNFLFFRHFDFRQLGLRHCYVVPMKRRQKVPKSCRHEISSSRCYQRDTWSFGVDFINLFLQQKGFGQILSHTNGQNYLQKLQVKKQKKTVKCKIFNSIKKPFNDIFLYLNLTLII